jgi:hypothetical protein
MWAHQNGALAETRFAPLVDGLAAETGLSTSCNRAAALIAQM